MCTVQYCASSCEFCQQKISEECRLYLQREQRIFNGVDQCHAEKNHFCEDPGCAASCLDCRRTINEEFLKMSLSVSEKSVLVDESVAAAKEKAQRDLIGSVPSSSSGKEMAHTDPTCSVPSSSTGKNIRSDTDKYFTDTGSGSNFLTDLFGGEEIFCGCRKETNKKTRKINCHVCSPRYCGCTTRNNKKTRRIHCPVHKTP